jgi:hypothetical protein
MTDATLFPMPDPQPNEPDWKHERCAVCLKPFTAKSWEDRHDFVYDNERFVHAKCCLCNKERTP